jgi:hypothetical protein
MPPVTQLMLRMADLWLAHIQAAYDEKPDAEILEELNELRTLRNLVEKIFNDEQEKQAALNAIPTRIAEFLQAAYPEYCPVHIVPWPDDTNRWYLNTKRRLPQEAHQWLDEHYPGLLIID